MASVETPREISIDKLSPREIIDRNLRVEREEIISIDDVLTDVSIVDEYHAERLGESMSQDRGQLTPILVRARLEDNGGGIFYDVMDGFSDRTLTGWISFSRNYFNILFDSLTLRLS